MPQSAVHIPVPLRRDLYPEPDARPSISLWMKAVAITAFCIRRLHVLATDTGNQAVAASEATIVLGHIDAIQGNDGPAMAASPFHPARHIVMWSMPKSAWSLVLPDPPLLLYSKPD